MRSLSIFYIVILFFNSCNTDKSHKELISKIQNSNFKMFIGITIKARYEKEGGVKAPFLTKEINGDRYLLPNFNYYGCSKPEASCLSKVSKKFDIEKYNSQFNTNKSINAYTFVYRSTSALFEEFERINVLRIYSNSVGDYIIFNINENDYLAYVPDINNIKNTFWKAKFIEKNKINEYWYSGVIASTH